MRSALALLTLATALCAQGNKYSSPWELLRGEHDKNHDGKVSAKEYTRGEVRFGRLDRNGDGFITESDMGGGRSGGGRRAGGRAAPQLSAELKAGRCLSRLLAAQGELAATELDQWFTNLDEDKNGKLAAKEITCVSNVWRKQAVRVLDKNDDGHIDLAEAKSGFTLADKDQNGRLSTAEMGRSRRGRQRGGGGRAAQRAPTVGEVAPGFTLKTLDGKSEVSLASFKNKKAVALIFGSYT
ncbi:MAG: hypothetical protein CMJ83_14650 [Planctomycetes bacterium]|nr:hypothetical protein [Planctomycetota bacterium]